MTANSQKARSIKDINARSGLENGTDVVLAPELALAEMKALAERAGAYARASKAPNTRLAYGKALRAIGRWCRARGLPTQLDGSPTLPMPPELVAAYIVARADQGQAVASLALVLSAVAYAHRQARLPSPLADPTLLDVWAGIKRSHGKPQRRAYPLSPRELRAMVLAQRWGIKAIRDRCIMVLGFAGAARPEELVRVAVEDLVPTENGRLLFNFPHSKGDQESKGQSVTIARGSDRATCPIAALEDWLSVSGIANGPIFRGMQHGLLGEQTLQPGDIGKILKRAARRAGFSRSRIETISGYSLRRGLATTARKEGKPLDAIQRQCRHQNIVTTMGYISAEELARSVCASEDIGL